MIHITTDRIPGKRVVKVIGLVRGNTIRSRHLGKDILAVFKNVVGGEIEEYTKMMAEAREQAIDRMLAEAKALGANGVAVRVTPLRTFKIKSGHYCRAYREVVSVGTVESSDLRQACRKTGGTWVRVPMDPAQSQ